MRIAWRISKSARFFPPNMARTPKASGARRAMHSAKTKRPRVGLRISAPENRIPRIIARTSSKMRTASRTMSSRSSISRMARSGPSNAWTRRQSAGKLLKSSYSERRPCAFHIAGAGRSRLSCCVHLLPLRCRTISTLCTYG